MSESTAIGVGAVIAVTSWVFDVNKISVLLEFMFVALPFLFLPGVCLKLKATN